MRERERAGRERRATIVCIEVGQTQEEAIDQQFGADGLPANDLTIFVQAVRAQPGRLFDDGQEDELL